MTTLTEYIALAKRARELSEKATPGDYELRCKEFSNVAPLEIWTDLGWLKELPVSYRQPTYEMIVENRTLVPQLCDAVERLTKALEKREEQLIVTMYNRFKMVPEYSDKFFADEIIDTMDLELEAILKGEK